MLRHYVKKAFPSASPSLCSTDSCSPAPIFNHSMNYRSVVILGRATLVDDPEEKLEALSILSEHILPGRWADSRQPNDQELESHFGAAPADRRVLRQTPPGPAIDDDETTPSPPGPESSRWK